MPKVPNQRIEPVPSLYKEQEPSRKRPWRRHPHWTPQPLPLAPVYPSFCRSEEFRPPPMDYLRHSQYRPNDLAYYENSEVRDNRRTDALPEDELLAAHYTQHERITRKCPPLYEEADVCEGKKTDVTAEDAKKIAFGEFLKTLTAFLVQAKNDENDVQLVRELMDSIFGDKVTKRRDDEEALTKRFSSIESSLSNVSNISDRIRTLEDQLKKESSLSDRVKALEEYIKNGKGLSKDKESRTSESDLLHRIERIESSIVIESGIIKRLEWIETRLPIQRESSKGTEGDLESTKNFDVTKRLINLETQMANASPILNRLDSMEHRLSVIETQLGVERRADTPVYLMDLTDISEVRNNEEIQSKRKNPSNKETDNEMKPTPEEAGVMRFTVGSDEFVSVHIDGVGTYGGEGSPGVRVWFGDDHPLNLSRPLMSEMSSNSAQLMASQIAVDFAIAAGLKKLAVYSTSNFLVKSMNKMGEWRLRQWRKKNGKPLKHTDAFKKLHRSLLSLTVVFREEKSENKARSLACVAPSIKEEKD